MATKDKNIWLLLIFILAGIVIFFVNKKDKRIIEVIK